MKLLAIFILIGLRLTPIIKADVECKDPQTPTNGRKYKINTTTMGYYCNKGFVLHGSSTSVCVNGEWSTSGQTCKDFLDVPEGWMGCGYPGRPLNGYRYIERMEENKLIYVCNSSYTLVGPRGRRCLKNGSWTPEIPNCVKNLAKDKRAEHSRSGFSKTFSTDDDVETCVSQPAEFHGYVDLEQISLFNTVQVLIKDGDKLGQVHFYVSKQSDGSNLEIHRIKSNVPKLLRFSITPVVARYLIISFQNQTSICDIKIYNSNETGSSCGQPDVPLNGKISRLSLNSATFQCESGYTMSGNPSIRCLHGFWETSLPVCVNSDTSDYQQPQINRDPETKFTAIQTPNESDEKDVATQHNDGATMKFISYGVYAGGGCVTLVVAICLIWRYRVNRETLRAQLNIPQPKISNANREMRPRPVSVHFARNQSNSADEPEYSYVTINYQNRF